MEANCKMIIIQGLTSFGIQGVNLRETIEKLVNEPEVGDPLEINGWVENLKNGNVKVIYRGKDEELFYNQLKALKKKYKCKDFYPFEHNDPEILDLEDFVVKRADDLSEMVWALRGAGYRFAQSTKTLEEIHESILKRDKDIVKGKLLMLHQELANIIVEFGSDKDKIYLEAMKSNFSFLVIPEVGFSEQLMTVFIELQEFLRTGSFVDTEGEHLKNNLNKLKTMVTDELYKKHGIDLRETTPK